MDLDRFKYDFVNVDIGKEYQDAYPDLYKLKSDFSKWLCEETIADTWLVSYQQTENKDYLGRKVASIGAWKIHDWFSNTWGVSFQ